MTARVNRTILILLGLILLAAGVLGLVLSFGGFGAQPAESPVLPEQLRSFADQNAWFWWVVALAGVLLALLALRWLLAQLRTDRVSRLDLTDDDRAGVTTVHTGAVCDAVEDEARTFRGVSGATAHIRGARDTMDLRVDLTDRADIADVRSKLEDVLVPHLRQALDDPHMPVDIELRLGRTSDRGLT